MYRVCKRFEFSACHWLIPPYEGRCNKRHGHTWRVEIVVASEMLDPCCMVMDFHDFAPLKNYIEKRFDHATVNNTVKQPTAENIARHIFDWARANWSGAESVRVWESESSWAEYRM